MADATRSVIDRLMATKAPGEALGAAADELEAISAELGRHPYGSQYEGIGEAATFDGESAAFFDHSPLLGQANPLAPPVRVTVTDDDTVEGRARFGWAYEGPPGCVHGGYVAAAFDEVLGATQALTGHPGMTGTLTIRYRSPTPLHVDLRFEGRLGQVEGRKIFTVGRLYDGDTLTAEAEAIFVRISRDRLMNLQADRDA